jgi:hypothetical protein
MGLNMKSCGVGGWMATDFYGQSEADGHGSEANAILRLPLDDQVRRPPSC